MRNVYDFTIDSIRLYEYVGGELHNSDVVPVPISTGTGSSIEALLTETHDGNCDRVVASRAQSNIRPVVMHVLAGLFRCVSEERFHYDTFCDSSRSHL